MKLKLFTILTVLALLTLGCAPAQAPNTQNGSDDAPTDPNASVIVTNFVTRINFTGGASEGLIFYTQNPNDCTMWPSGAFHCYTLGGPILVLEIGYTYVYAQADSSYDCTSGCAIASNAKEKYIWVVGGENSRLTEDVYQDFQKLLDQ